MGSRQYLSRRSWSSACLAIVLGEAFLCQHGYHRQRNALFNGFHSPQTNDLVSSKSIFFTTMIYPGPWEGLTIRIRYQISISKTPLRRASFLSLPFSVPQNSPKLIRSFLNPIRMMHHPSYMYSSSETKSLCAWSLFSRRPSTSTVCFFPPVFVFQMKG